MIEKRLPELALNEEAEVAHINGGWMMKTRLKDLGVGEGQTIKRISRIGLGGPVIILVNRAQVAIGSGMASRIMVKSHGQIES
jgi:ferrous iron transport protein A